MSTSPAAASPTINGGTVDPRSDSECVTTTPVHAPYRPPLRTSIEAVDASAIVFRPSPNNSLSQHPFDNPTLTITSSHAECALNRAAQMLRDGNTVAFPTETVYGLGADATSCAAVRKIYEAKSRPSDNPLIIHIASLKQLRKLLPDSTIPPIYDVLIKKFWPGPLTILLPLPNPSPLSFNVTATQPTFAARMPRHPIPLALSALCQLPLAAPSANASGKPSPTDAAHVFNDLRTKIPLIIDGGGCEVGLESTVVDGLRNPPVVLRPGGVSVEAIRACGGGWEKIVVASNEPSDDDTAPRAPGMKYKHYSPRAAVILYEAGAPHPSNPERLLPVPVVGGRVKKLGILRTRRWPEGFAERILREAGDINSEVYEVALGEQGKEISHGLFRMLRWLDDQEVDLIHVEGIEMSEEGLAVMNRLEKAAAILVRNR